MCLLSCRVQQEVGETEEMMGELVILVMMVYQVDLVRKVFPVHLVHKA